MNVSTPSAPRATCRAHGFFASLPIAIALTASTPPIHAIDLLSRATQNDAAYIPPQCYTDTIDLNGDVHNPCYSCHQVSTAPNFANDQALQLSYDFAEYSLINRWSNLFIDRSRDVIAISDAEIIDYISVDNYRDDMGRLILAERLRDLPPDWDYDGDGRWDGFIPDCWYDFDDEGFDRDPEGRDTGWRTFGYYPFLGTFWPTNGSTDDVLIKLPASMRKDAAGNYDRTIYKLNLAIVEALIKRSDVPIDAADETALGVDLDKDGSLGTATVIAYDWAPIEGRTMSYVGRAKTLLASGDLHLAAGLYPEGTEFLHSVRYIAQGADGDTALSPRMKELRYGKKMRWVDYATLDAIVDADEVEKWAFPDRLRQISGDIERGLSNGQGWVYQGFIEDSAGDLRPQNYEETVFCMGCHGILGSTTDTTFAFPRKFDATQPRQGWFHWTQHGLRGIPDPRRTDGRFEYSHYLEQNGAGDEFRGNGEIRVRFFNADGTLRQHALDILHDDVAALLYPSRQRALRLNKAYRIIVQEQSFIHGRDATIRPPFYVRWAVSSAEPTGVEDDLDNP